MPRKDKNITPSVTQRLQELGYNVSDWDDSGSNLTVEVRTALSTASKNETGQTGYPDRVYVNKHEKLLILVEEKSSVKDHHNPDKTKGAINGVKWYLEQFLNCNLPKKVKNSFDNWKILGIAVSGNLYAEYQNEFTCFTLDIENQKISILPQVHNFLTEQQFLALFNSLNEEKAVSQVSTSSKKINNLLRSIDSQKRPVLLSALMICLHRVKANRDNYCNDFPDHYKTFSAKMIIANLFEVVRSILRVEGIPEEKLAALKTELAFLDTDQILCNSDILKEVLLELETTVIPLFEKNFASNSNYDIIGKFYEEFLKYAGVSNVKRGIVLTPRHITTLFTKLVDLRDTDRILDLCCGTGAFLIAGMNTLIKRIMKSSRSDKNNAVAKVKEEQLLGFESNATMYICAISNMLFRGDGKSSIYHYDSICNQKTNEILEKFAATVGFINPPYSGKETKENPTPKEITFLTKLLDNCSRAAVIIAPLSIYFKDEKIRANILKKHTLRCVINMPGDLFQPNASTHTAVAVFDTNRSFDYDNDEVVFYDLRDDGFAMSKNQGRTDAYDKWAKIEQELLDALKPTATPDGICLVRSKIKPGDEWTIYAHSKTDYSALCEDDFVSSILDFAVFEAKKSLNILDEKLPEAKLQRTLSVFFEGTSWYNANLETSHKPLDTSGWKEFTLCGKGGLFEYQHGTRLTVPARIAGDIPLITAGQYNQGYAQSISNYKEEECFEPGMTIDMFCNVFYQNYRFAADDNIYIFNKPQPMNKYIGLFMVTVCKKLQHKYGYGRQYRKEDTERNKILLPVKSGGLPDWAFMEDYIKNLPYDDLI